MAAHEFLNHKNWVVCGDVTNEKKFAYIILHTLRDNGYQAQGYHPRAREGTGVYSDLKELPFVPDVLDLVVSPGTGLEVVKAAHEAGITRVMAQPGARSAQIRQYCEDNGLEYAEECVLVEMKK